MTERDRPVYLMVPRKVTTAVIAAFICAIILGLVAIQWTNYVDRKSNQRLCGVIALFTNTSTTDPVPANLSRDMAILSRNYKCT